MPHEISGNVERAVRMTSQAHTDSVYMGFWGEWDGTQSSPVCWGQYQRVPLSARGMWNWNNSSREGSKPHHLHEIYGVGPATELTGFDLGELLNHVWLKNSLQRIISAFWVNEKPARTIYGSKRPSIRGRGKKSHKKNPQEPLMWQSSWSVWISNSTFFCQIYWVLLEFILLSPGVCGGNLQEKKCVWGKMSQIDETKSRE